MRKEIEGQLEVMNLVVRRLIDDAETGCVASRLRLEGIEARLDALALAIDGMVAEMQRETEGGYR